MSHSTHKKKQWRSKQKHPPHNSGENGSKEPASQCPYVEVFQEFSNELDLKHDKHERLVKLSRDCTIRSKRVIFLLHRISGNESGKTAILSEAEGKIRNEVLPLLRSIALEISGEDPKRFHSAFSPGVQEFIEALTYFEYLKRGRLVSVEETQEYLTFTLKLEEKEVTTEKSSTITETVEKNNAKAEVEVSEEQIQREEKVEIEEERVVKLPLEPLDFILGIADLTGELMRLSINSVGTGDRSLPFELLPFIRAIHCGFHSIRSVNKEMSRKISVLRTSLGKVENVCYTLKIRGSEFPKQMLSHVIDASGRDEGYMETSYDSFS